MKKYLLILSILLFPGLAGATSFFVTTTGSGTACTSVSPCGTIAQGIATAHGAGNTLTVAAGTYNESPTVSSGGSAGNPFIIQGFAIAGSCPTTASTDIYNPTGSRPNPSVTTNGWTLSGSYVRVDCFKTNAGNTITGTGDDFWDGYLNMANTSGIGVNISGAVNCTVERNYIYYPREGTEINNGSGCLIQDNETNGLQLLGTTNSGSDMDYNRIFNTSGVTYSHNYMHNAEPGYCGDGTGAGHLACHIDCLQTWNTGSGGNTVHDVIFDRNVCMNSMDGLIWRDTYYHTAGVNLRFYNVTVTNNIFAFQPGAGGTGPGWAVFFEHVGNVTVSANTWVWRNATFDQGTTGTVQNNINIDQNITCSTNNPIYVTNGSSITENHNIWTDACVTYSGWPNDLINIDPKFVSYDRLDCPTNCNYENFNLQSSSPAIGAGATGLGITVDQTGYTRPSPPAIGAFEFQTGGTAPGVTFNCPSGLSFGNINVGSSSSVQTCTVTNSGNASLSISTAPHLVTGTQFSMTTDCGSTLAASASCHDNVTFSPTTAGSLSDTVSMSDNATGSPHIFTVSGTGISTNSIVDSISEPCGATITLSTTPTNCTFATPGPGYLLDLVVQFHPGSGNHNAVLTAVDDNTLNSWTIVPGANAIDTSVGADDAVGQWYVSHNLGGENTLTLTANQTAIATVVLHRVANVNHIDQVCVASTQSTSGTANGCSITSTVANEFISSAGWYNGSLTGSVSAPFVLGYTQSAGQYMDAIVSSTGSYHTTWTVSGATTFDSSTVSFAQTSPTPPVPAFTPTGLSFPNTYAGNASTALTLLITNSGGAPLPIFSITSTGSDFTNFTNIDCPTTPLTLASGAACHVSVQFAPGSAGNKTGTINLQE